MVGVIHNNTWREKGIKTNLGRKQYRLIKYRHGGLDDSPKKQRDAIEYTPNDAHPMSTQFLPYNWWVVCMGGFDRPDPT